MQFVWGALTALLGFAVEYQQAPSRKPALKVTGADRRLRYAVGDEHLVVNPFPRSISRDVVSRLPDAILKSVRCIFLFILVTVLATHASCVHADNSARASAVLALRENVVKIKASLQPGSAPQIGFGFVVGKQDDQAVIVTANHVVRDKTIRMQLPKRRSLRFTRIKGVEVPGVLQLATSAPTSRGDVAVILVPWPSRLTIANQASIVDPVVKDDSVWLIGKGGAWEEFWQAGANRQSRPR